MIKVSQSIEQLDKLKKDVHNLRKNPHDWDF